MRIFDKKLFALIVLAALLFSAIHIFGLGESLDAKLYYTRTEAHAFLSALTPAQTHAYILNECLDLCFLVTYTAIFTLALTRLRPQDFKILILALTPGLFDLIETSSILFLLNFSLQPPFFLGAVTLLKWSAVVVALLTIARTAIKKVQLRRR